MWNDGVQGLQELHLAQAANSQQLTEENELQVRPLNDVKEQEPVQQEECKKQSLERLHEEIQLTKALHSQWKTEESARGLNEVIESERVHQEEYQRINQIFYVWTWWVEISWILD